MRQGVSTTTTAPMMMIQKWSNISQFQIIVPSATYITNLSFAADLWKTVLVAMTLYPKFPQLFTPGLCVYVSLAIVALYAADDLKYPLFLQPIKTQKAAQRK